MRKSIIKSFASVAMTCLLYSTAPDAQAASGPALSLNGVNAYASVSDNPSLDLGTTDGQGFTIEAWFYVPDLNGEGLQTLIYKQSAYALFINFHTSQADQMFFRLWSLALPAPGYVTLYANPTDLSVGWHHAAAVFDNQPGGGNDAGAVYLDGNRMGLGTGLNFDPGIGNSSSQLYIGAYAGVNPFNGWIDELRLSDIVRYSGASYTVPTAPFAADSNTRALWHFDETPGSTAFADASANGNTLTGTNGAQTGTPPTVPDTTPPTVTSIVRLAPTNQFLNCGSVTWRVTFSEHVTNVSTADFTLVNISGTLTGEAITSVSAGSGTNIDVSATVGTGGEGDLRLDVLASTATISDDAGNSLNASFTSGQVYTVDRTPPTVLTINRSTPTSQITSASSVTWRVTFSEHVNNVSTADFALVDVSTNLAGEAITSVSASSGNTIDVTASTGSTGSGDLRLDVLAGMATITDDVSNSLNASFTGGQVYSVIRKAPATVTLTNLLQTHDGTAKAVSVTTIPPGLVVNITYDGSATSPTNVGYYTVVGTVNDVNYQGSTTNTLVISVVANRYVNVDSPGPAAPYASWSTAATTVQDAVDLASAGELILVADGLYQTGERAVSGTMTVRVAVTKPLTVSSVSGPSVTYIVGRGPNGPTAMRCVNLANGAMLVGFTLTNGATRTSGNAERDMSGGGVWCEGLSAVVSNCVLTSNSASWGGGGAYSGTLNNCTLTGNSSTERGGGAYFGTLNYCTLTGNSASPWGVGGGAGFSTLNNCTLTGNSAFGGGGGTYSGTLNNCTLTGNSASPYQGAGGGANGGALNNCTLTGNSASWGGGAYYCTLNNCIAYYNGAGTSGTNHQGGTFSYCCTTPLPTGAGNFTNAPLFVNSNGWSTLRLQAGSPCINAGNNTVAPGSTDLDCNPRIVGGTVDIGAYEFQSPASRISYAWLQSYGFPTDGSADYADPDHDGMNNWQEWIAGTDPTDVASALRMLSLSQAANGIAATWSSVTGRTYFLQRATNPAAAPTFSIIQSNLPGQPSTTGFTDTNPPPSSPAYYRVGVQPSP